MSSIPSLFSQVMSGLLPNQQKVCEALVRMLQEYKASVVDGVVGSGKTITTCSSIRLTGNQIVLVAPFAAFPAWEKCVQQMVPGCALMDTIKITSLAGRFHPDLIEMKHHPDNMPTMTLSRTGVVKSHDYLIRHDVLTKTTKALSCTSYWTPTEKWIHLIRQGHVTLVIDESHMSKNISSDRSQALSYLAASLRQYDITNTCHIILVSATLQDKEEHTLSHLRTLGFLPPAYDEDGDAQSLFERNQLTSSFDSFRMYCERLDPQATMHALSPFQQVLLSTQYKYKDMFYRLLFQLWTRIILPRIRSTIEPVRDIQTNRCIRMEDQTDFANGFFFLPTFSLLEQYLNYVKRLDQLVAFRKKPHTAPVQGVELMSQIIQCVAEGEYIKIQGLMEEQSPVMKTIRESPFHRVIVAVEYNRSFQFAVEAATRMNVPFLSICGDTPAAERVVRMNQFQACNKQVGPVYTPPAFQLLIVKTQVFYQSIDADDQVGEFPTFLYVMPSYQYTSLQQIMGRIFRAMTIVKNPLVHRPTCRFVYFRHVLNDSVLITDSVRRSSTLPVEVQRSLFILFSRYSEERILFSLQRKASVSKQVHQEQVTNGVVFISDMKNKVEIGVRPVTCMKTWTPSSCSKRKRDEETEVEAEAKSQIKTRLKRTKVAVERSVQRSIHKILIPRKRSF